MGHMKAPVHRARRPRAHDFAALAATVKTWGRELGFQAVGIADTDLAAVEPGLAAWLERGFAGELDYMRKHGAKRTRPSSLAMLSGAITTRCCGDACGGLPEESNAKSANSATACSPTRRR